MFIRRVKNTTINQGRLKGGGGQTGQLPGAQHFGGPINYLRNIFLLFIKKKIFINSIFIHYILLYTINFN